MELGSRIKQYRSTHGWNQDDLAEKIYVTRQTISNWENDKSYPDVKSLLLLSEVFHTSLDTLIKGDVEIMKQHVKQEDKKEFEKLSAVFTVLLLAMMITPIPLAHFFGFVGIGIWVLLLAAGMYVAILVEKKKRKFDIQTYREIIAFTEGKGLDEIAKAKEEGKRPYQKILLAMAAGVITLLIAIVFTVILK